MQEPGRSEASPSVSFCTVSDSKISESDTMHIHNTPCSASMILGRYTCPDRLLHDFQVGVGRARLSLIARYGSPHFILKGLVVNHKTPLARRPTEAPITAVQNRDRQISDAVATYG
jgi:hypothetical protein